MTTHSDHRFSIMVKTDDLAVVGCLRALAKFSQKVGNNNIPWGGTKDDDWIRDGNTVTFFFSSPSFRDGFVGEINRLLPQNLWSIVGTDDLRSAAPQRR